MEQLPLIPALLISLSSHAPAKTILSRLIPFLAQHSIHNFLSQLKFMSRYSVNELLSDISIKILRISILLRLSVTSLINCTKLYFR
jgi:hypothetical protein